MKTRFTISILCVFLLWEASNSIAAELLISPSRAKWERILGGINESFGENFLTRMEDFTGVQRRHDSARSMLRNSFGIDPKVVSYCQFLTISKKGEDVRDFRATFLIVETDDAVKIEKEFKKIPNKSARPISVNPLIANIFRDENFLILVIFDGVELRADERKIISIIEELCREPK